MSPAPHGESPLQVVVVAGADLVLVQQLVGHLVRHRRQTAGVQVEDDGTCKAVELLSAWTSSIRHQLSVGVQVTCAHGPPELQQTLEGEVRDVRRSPLPCVRVEVLLIAQPASRLLPETAPELVQLHVGLPQTGSTSSFREILQTSTEENRLFPDWWEERTHD